MHPADEAALIEERAAMLQAAYLAKHRARRADEEQARRARQHRRQTPTTDEPSPIDFDALRAILKGNRNEPDHE